MVPKLRIARATNDLDALLPFYRDGLGLSILSSFKDHSGFDGVMLGHPNAAYHFEFTRKQSHDAGRAPTMENLVVFYLPVAADFSAALARMQDADFAPVPSFNPYWDEKGRTFEDPDGYRVVLQGTDWPP